MKKRIRIVLPLVLGLSWLEGSLEELIHGQWGSTSSYLAVMRTILGVGLLVYGISLAGNRKKKA